MCLYALSVPVQYQSCYVLILNIKYYFTQKWLERIDHKTQYHFLLRSCVCSQRFKSKINIWWETHQSMERIKRLRSEGNSSTTMQVSAQLPSALHLCDALQNTRKIRWKERVSVFQDWAGVSVYVLCTSGCESLMRLASFMIFFITWDLSLPPTHKQREKEGII